MKHAMSLLPTRSILLFSAAQVLVKLAAAKSFQVEGKTQRCAANHSNRNSLPTSRTKRHQHVALLHDRPMLPSSGIILKIETGAA